MQSRGSGGGAALAPVVTDEAVAAAVLIRAQEVQHLSGCPVSGTEDPALAARVERYEVVPPRFNSDETATVAKIATHCTECGAISYTRSVVER